MSAKRLETWFSLQKDLGFLVIRGHNYDVRATVDGEMLFFIASYRWRLRTDGHLVNEFEQRLSHLVWLWWNGRMPDGTIWHKNDDLLDYRLENLELRPRHAKIQLTPQTQEEGTVDIPSTGLPLGINNDSDSLICPPVNS